MDSTNGDREMEGQVRERRRSDVPTNGNMQVRRQRRPSEYADERSRFTRDDIQTTRATVDDQSYHGDRAVRRSSVEDHEYDRMPPRLRKRKDSAQSPHRGHSRRRSSARTRSLSPRPRRHRKSETTTEDLVDRTFDKSLDGIVAAAAGAGFGALSARQLGKANPHHVGEDVKWKTIGAALLGALAFNVGEKKLAKFFEERESGSW